MVIPKEIRRTMRIREGDPLEIYTDREGEVIFKKYSPIGELNAFAAGYAETLYKTCSLAVAICDRDAVIACAGLPRREFADRRLSAELETIIASRSLYLWEGGAPVRIVDGGEGYMASVIMPIITEGDITGCVASVISDADPEQPDRDSSEVKLIQTAASFLSRQLEA